MIEIRIVGIEDLMAFVAIIKGEELDLEKLKKLTTEFNKTTDTLIKTENAQPK